MSPRIINIISNSNYPSRRTAKQLMNKLTSVGLTPVTKLSHDAELTITVGGDGAFIKAVNLMNFSSIPIVGINTGHLGFYQEISPEDIDEFVDAYIEGNYTVEKLYLVGADIFTKKRRFFVHAVNEVVLKAQHSKVIHLNVFIDRTHLEKFSGDGMILSSPTGSSGYNSSAGGSLVHPSLKCLSLTPLAGISNEFYRSVRSSIIVPGDHVISLVPEKRYASSNLLVVDGKEYSYQQLQRVNVRIADKHINKLVFRENNYWENIKSKFL